MPNDNSNYKSCARLAIAIENLAGMIFVGMVFLAVAVADGVAQFVIALVGLLFFYAMAKADTSSKEKYALGLFSEKQAESVELKKSNRS